MMPMTEALQRDIDRVWTLWGDARSAHADAGPWLLGSYSLADAMFAPVVFRFATYGVQPPDDLSDYCKRVIQDPDIQPWLALAGEEAWIVEADEAGEEAD
jgi:glutathione S-transferase